MKPKSSVKRKRRDALKKWLKDRLGSLQPKEQQGTASQTKLSA
ncbi:hypothetical protein ACFO4N_15530 [Camelliibacillus cellulosilyticus]|uniref:Uncharacterized protein n=1 Tax=Camelliibacillus cellulosilyticus TaxID=2174486 RepID=A0ABV9GRD9_9BACL